MCRFIYFCHVLSCLSLVCSQWYEGILYIKSWNYGCFFLFFNSSSNSSTSSEHHLIQHRNHLSRSKTISSLRGKRVICLHLHPHSSTTRDPNIHSTSLPPPTYHQQHTQPHFTTLNPSPRPTPKKMQLSATPTLLSLLAFTLTLTLAAPIASASPSAEASASANPIASAYPSADNSNGISPVYDSNGISPNGNSQLPQGSDSGSLPSGSDSGNGNGNGGGPQSQPPPSSQDFGDLLREFADRIGRYGGGDEEWGVRDDGLRISERIMYRLFFLGDVEIRIRGYGMEENGIDMALVNGWMGIYQD